MLLDIHLFCGKMRHFILIAMQFITLGHTLYIDRNKIQDVEEKLQISLREKKLREEDKAWNDMKTNPKAFYKYVNKLKKTANLVGPFLDDEGIPLMLLSVMLLSVRLLTVMLLSVMLLSVRLLTVMLLSVMLLTVFPSSRSSAV